jgi:hypothetical protein
MCHRLAAEAEVPIFVQSIRSALAIHDVTQRQIRRAVRRGLHFVVIGLFPFLLGACGTSANIENAGAPNASVAARPVAVLSVTGASGDGNKALAAAMQQELAKSGIATTDNAGAAFRVEGRVTVGAAQSSQQPLSIAWNVRDPAGKSLGDVVQNRTIPRGTLDRQWGETADAAAKASAKEIASLMVDGKITQKPQP